MPLSNSDFGIRINTEADITALKQTLAALEADTEAAKRMGLSIGNAEQDISKMRKALEDHAKAGGEVALSHREIKIATTELLEAGGLGDLRGLLHGLFSVEAMGAFAGILAFQKISELLTEIQQKTIDAANWNRELKATFEDAHVHAVIAATSAAKAFDQELKLQAAARDLITMKMERDIAVLKEKTTNTETLIDAQLRLNKARLDQAVERGQVTPGAAEEKEQAMQRKARADKDAAEDKGAADKHEDRREASRKYVKEIADTQQELDAMNKDTRTSEAVKDQKDKAVKETALQLAKAIAEENQALGASVLAKAALVGAAGSGNPTKLALASTYAEYADAAIGRATTTRINAEKNSRAADAHLTELEEADAERNKAMDAKKALIKADTDKYWNNENAKQNESDTLRETKKTRAAKEAADDAAQVISNRTAREKAVNAGGGDEVQQARAAGYNIGAMSDPSVIKGIFARIAAGSGSQADQDYFAGHQNASLAFRQSSMEGDQQINALDAQITTARAAVRNRSDALAPHKLLMLQEKMFALMEELTERTQDVDTKRLEARVANLEKRLGSTGAGFHR